MPATLQRNLPLADARFRPTLGMDGAKHLLDLSEDEILALIDEGLITHAWNIATPSAEKREVRILRQALDAYVTWNENPKLVPARPGVPITANYTDALIFSFLLPPSHVKPFLTNGELQRSLNCVSDHVLNLIDSRALELQPGTKYTRGPNGCALVTVTSFERFLKQRRLP